MRSTLMLWMPLIGRDDMVLHPHTAATQLPAHPGPRCSRGFRETATRPPSRARRPSPTAQAAGPDETAQTPDESRRGPGKRAAGPRTVQSSRTGSRRAAPGRADDVRDPGEQSRWGSSLYTIRACCYLDYKNIDFTEGLAELKIKTAGAAEPPSPRDPSHLGGHKSSRAGAPRKWSCGPTTKPWFSRRL